MSILVSHDFKEKYKKSRIRVKQWEEDFRSQNGRTPTKIDIKSASANVKGYYKIYWKLKAALLEDLISGEPAELPLANISRSDSVLKEHTNMITESKPILSKHTGNDMLCDKNEGKIDENHVSNENLYSRRLKKDNSDDKTWGSHLNKSATVIASVKKHTITRTSSNISEKLFEGSSFKKRNPRKSVSFSKKKSNVSVLSSEDIPSPNDFRNLSFQSGFSPMPDNTDNSVAEPLFSVQNDCSPKIKALISSKSAFSPLFSKSEKFHVVSEAPVLLNQSVSFVQRAVTETLTNLKSARKLNIDWIERCNEVESSREFQVSSDSGFESLESSANSLLTGVSKILMDETTLNETTLGEISSDDEIIGDSDSETNDNSNLMMKFTSLSQKRKSEGFDMAKNASVACDPVQSEKKMKLDFSVYDFSSKKDDNMVKTKNSMKKEILEEKMKKGTLNENYVKINMKKKVFVRGKKNFNYAKHKKQQWKAKKKSLLEDDDRQVGGVLRCFKCGDVGHYARYCQKKSEDKMLSEEHFNELGDDDGGLMTLEEAKEKAGELAASVHSRRKNYEQSVTLSQVQPETESDPSAPTFIPQTQATLISPLYNPNTPTPPEVLEALSLFGHSSFRSGQEEAIMRILTGQSTLLAISTGSGKSLCYQLPAYLYAKKSKCIAVVVSPLVSLMEDQVSSSPAFCKLGCLHNNQTPKQREAVLADLSAGRLCALLLSPEAVASCDSSNSALGSLLSQLPPVAFACIDEVHCVSQWSHNFRPCYLMINKILREKLGVRTILGLTATATKTTIAGIVRELGITDDSGVIRDTPLPGNLCLSVSVDQDKDRALLALLRGARFAQSASTLVYCTRRDECERLAALIRTLHTDTARPENAKSKRLSWNAEAYHAGMTAARRKQVQKEFMGGNLKIVVATVAFGMGINKTDIRGVVHYNMPKDFESYVQEVGRAGRDGLPAHCHLFLDTKGRDLCELRRHVHANSIDRFVVRKLLERVFVPCSCVEGSCSRHELAFDCSATIQALDIPEENIYTLLCYLELHPQQLVKVLTPVYTQCKIQSYNGPRALVAATKKCPPLAVAMVSNPGSEKTSCLDFDVVEIARIISWDSGVVKSQLKNLEWTKTKAGKWKKSGVIVEFMKLGFRVAARGDLPPGELNDALDYLTERVRGQEERALHQIHVLFSALSHFAFPSSAACLEDFDQARSDALKRIIRTYFEMETLSEDIPLKDIQNEDFEESTVASDVSRLVCTFRDNSFNGRAVARIFHGIQSPNYPASLWYRCGYWRGHVDKDFDKLVRIANKEILRLK